MPLTIKQWAIGYGKKTSPRRRVAYTPRGGGVETATRGLPAHYQAIVGPDDLAVGSTLQVRFRLDMIEREGTVQVAPVGVRIEPEDGFGLSAAQCRQVPFGDLFLDAVQRWSENSDDSDVTPRQAKALLRPIAYQRNRYDQDWQVAADAYLSARADGRPTTAAVADALDKSRTKLGLDQARHIIRQARKAGLIPPAKSTRS